MARHPKVFNPLFVAMTEAGEMGGMLESALRRVADQLEKDASLRRQVKSALVYPVLVIVLAVGVMLALCAFLIPVFIDVFKEFGGKLPAITQVSVFAVELVTHYCWAMFLGHSGRDGDVHQVEEVTWGRKQWDRFRLRIPMKIGTIVQQVAVARWSRTLASLTSAGVPLLQALEITGRTGGNIAVEEAMDGVIASVKRGGTIAAPLAQAPIFPSDGHAHGRRRRGNGRPGRDARKGRRVLRRPGRGVGQGADFDHGADHDHGDRCDGRVHRDLDVPAAV